MRMLQVKELVNGDLELKPEGLDSRTHAISFFFFPLNLVILAEIKKKIHSFIYLWLCWVLVAVNGPSPCGEQGLLYSGAARIFHCSGFSHCGAWSLDSRASVALAHGR